LPDLPKARPADLGPERWAEGISPDGAIQLNDFQQQLIELAQLIEREQPPVATPETIDQTPPPEPPFRSEAELGEFIEAFRRRQMDQM
jgi:hypothetical protein